MAVEPLLDAGEQLHVAAELHQVVAVDAHAARLGLLVHEVHVGDEAVGAVLAGERVGLGPERLGVLADLGQERVFLHGLGGERAVEIVDERDGLLVELRLAAGLGGPLGLVRLANLGRPRLRV